MSDEPSELDRFESCLCGSLLTWSSRTGGPRGFATTRARAPRRDGPGETPRAHRSPVLRSVRLPADASFCAALRRARQAPSGQYVLVRQGVSSGCADRIEPRRDECSVWHTD